MIKRVVAEAEEAAGRAREAFRLVSKPAMLMLDIIDHGKRYGCRRVVLVYPMTKAFRETLVFRFVGGDDLEMACFPFDVADPAGTVGALMRELTA